ncbi:MAG: polysaccharide biosynthesis protein [Clostridia bacterium]|nr:polysaccharide biosynthesis protein [Clostridia bacterium]
MAKEQHGKNFMYGAAVLLVANILVKIIGACFKIPLTYLLDEAGMGLFTTSYTIYTWLFVVATAGLPVAISKMVAESSALGKTKETKKILHASLVLLAIIGVVGTSVLYFCADAFADFTKSPLAAHGIRAIAPALLFVSFMSAFRGYFQGTQDMVPTASSEVAEALGKLIIGYILASLLIPRGIEYGAAGAVFGVSMGAAMGLAVLLIMYFTRKNKNAAEDGDGKTSSMGSILKKMLFIAIPITIGASVFTLTTVIDMCMIQRRLLAAGFESKRALELWGSYSGYAIPLFNMPPTLVTSISISLVPAISAAFARQELDDARKMTSSALKTTILLAAPCGIGITVLARPILQTVYNNTNAASTLSILGYAVIFVSLVLVTNGVLQALGKVWLPVIHMAIGGVVKVIINFFLVGSPDININGAPVGTTVCYVLILALNLISIKRLLKCKYDIASLLEKPLICVAVMALVSFFACRFAAGTGRIFSVLIPIVLGGIAYVLMLFATKSLTDEDVLMLPKGEKLLSLFKKVGAMK